MGNAECGMRTRRRPIGRDYAAAKDAEFGMRLSGKSRLLKKTPVGAAFPPGRMPYGLEAAAN